MLASIDPETEVERVLLTHECGVTCRPEDSAAFIETLRELLDNPDATAAMGDRGRRFVESWVSPTGVATAYIDLFDELRSSR